MKSSPPLFDENFVVECVAAFLVRHGFVIEQKLTTKELGVDIRATHPQSNEIWLVEAKGQTSSKLQSLRYGKPFNASQIRVHVAMAFYAASMLRQRHPDRNAVHVGIALPDDNGHRTRVADIAQIITNAGIKMLWVSVAGQVRLGGGAVS